jgi:hypothetical protein
MFHATYGNSRHQRIFRNNAYYSHCELLICFANTLHELFEFCQLILDENREIDGAL